MPLHLHLTPGGPSRCRVARPRPFPGADPRAVWRYRLFLLVVAGLLLLPTGCLRRTREISGTVSLRRADGRVVHLSQVRVSAYPKHVAKLAFAKAAPRIGAQFTQVAAQMEAVTQELSELTRTDGLDPQSAALLREVDELLALREAAGDEPGLRETVDRRLADLRADAARGPGEAALQRIDRVMLLRGRFHARMTSVTAAAPEMGRLLMASLPPAEIVDTTDAEGRFSLRIPAGAPYVLGASVLRRSAQGPAPYAWMVPVPLALGTDVVVNLDADNLLATDDQTKELAGSLQR